MYVRIEAEWHAPEGRCTWISGVDCETLYWKTFSENEKSAENG